MEKLPLISRGNNLFLILFVILFSFFDCQSLPEFKQKQSIDLTKISIKSSLGEEVHISKTAKNEYFIVLDLDSMKSGLDIPTEMSKGLIRKAFIVVQNSEGTEIGRQLLALENRVIETRILQENDKKENSKIQSTLSTQSVTSQNILLNSIPVLGSHLVASLEFIYLEPCDPVFCEKNRNLLNREWNFISKPSFFKISKIDGLIEKKLIEDETKIKEAPILKKEEKKERNYPQQKKIKPIG